MAENKLYMISMLVWANESGYDKHCGRKDNATDNECTSLSCARGYQYH